MLCLCIYISVLDQQFCDLIIDQNILRSSLSDFILLESFCGSCCSGLKSCPVFLLWRFVCTALLVLCHRTPTVSLSRLCQLCVWLSTLQFTFKPRCSSEGGSNLIFQTCVEPLSKQDCVSGSYKYFMRPRLHLQRGWSKKGSAAGGGLFQLCDTVTV